MKMRKFFSMIMLVGAVAVAATSCKKDDDTTDDARRNPFVGSYSAGVLVTGMTTVGMPSDTLYFANQTFTVSKDGGNDLKLSGVVANASIPGLPSINIGLTLTPINYDEQEGANKCYSFVPSQAVAFTMPTGISISCNVAGLDGAAYDALLQSTLVNAATVNTVNLTVAATIPMMPSAAIKITVMPNDN